MWVVSGPGTCLVPANVEVQVSQPGPGAHVAGVGVECLHQLRVPPVQPLLGRGGRGQGAGAGRQLAGHRAPEPGTSRVQGSDPGQGGAVHTLQQRHCYHCDFSRKK